jgi:hypothetical protein
LFKHFLKENQNKYESIITYAKRDYSNGDLYKKLGFKFKNVCNPGFYWIIDGKRKHRYNYRKDKIANELNNNMTATEIMHGQGFIRCFDSGNLKFEFNNFLT